MTAFCDTAVFGSDITKAAEGNNSGEYTASAQVWNTTELLEHIISYLPVKSIVAVSGVDKMSHNCVVNSTIAQSKLFMRPSGRAPDHWVYCEYYIPSTQLWQLRQLVAQSFEPSMDVFNKIRAEKSDSEGRPLSVVALCPLLELEDTQETAALARLKRRDWKDTERAHITRLPAENTRYADMILTDPPVNELDVELTYKHSLWPLLRIEAKRRIKNKVGLTIGALLGSARSELGDTYVYEPPMPSNNYGRAHACVTGSAVNDVILQTVQENGGSFALDLANSKLIFQSPRIVVPNDQEMMEMDAKRNE
jgi:hypothetical protein